MLEKGYFSFDGVVSAIFIGIGQKCRYYIYDNTCQTRQMLMHEKHVWCMYLYWIP